jgi:hypothetical protein
VSARTRLIARCGPGPAPIRSGGCPAIERHPRSERGPGTWLLAALLLVSLTTPAFGFDDAAQSPPTAEHIVLDSSGVPTSANWVVLDATGIAAWRAQGDNQWHPFTRGEVLPLGCEIETGSDGEITLVAGGDQLTIAPQGRLIVPVAQPGQDRRLRHERGRILMQIESREDRDVRVDTPLLSLGIKGTTFEVLVEPEQDSVVVHEGDVEVTTPGRDAPVDLGAGEGLRQPAVPGSEATRFDLPAPEGSAGTADGPAWRLQPAGTGDRGEPQTYGPPAERGPVGTPGRADTTRSGARPKPGSFGPWLDFGKLDELASSWKFIAIATVGLLLLTIPALVLLQHLREQRSGRPTPTGQRRRQLVRG